ncbi:MAG: Rab family GTPase [Promethearchaeota archaeon]
MEEYDCLFKISIFGDKDVGKKTFFKRFYPGFNEKMSSINTTGVDFCYKDINTLGAITKLQFWIYSDSKRFKPIIHQYLKGSVGIILMYDITNPNSLNYLSEALQSATDIRERYNVPILLVGNKSDLKENREVAEEQIKKFKFENIISKSMEISIKTGENVAKSFQRIIRMSLKGTDLEIKISRRKRIESHYRRIEPPYRRIEPPYRRIETPSKPTISSKRYESKTIGLEIAFLIPILYLLTFFGNLIKDSNNFILIIAWILVLVGLIITLIA